MPSFVQCHLVRNLRLPRILTIVIITTLMLPFPSAPPAPPMLPLQVRMSGNYAGVSLWGDNDDIPTAIVLKAGTAAPVFT